MKEIMKGRKEQKREGRIEEGRKKKEEKNEGRKKKKATLPKFFVVHISQMFLLAQLLNVQHLFGSLINSTNRNL